jgi:uncharacterized protein (TIGR02444 family)
MPVNDTKNNESLWNFSCSFYAKRLVEARCLQLQDEHGVNVDLLLWCLWLERRQLCLTAAMLSIAKAAIDPWDKHYVQALRKLRRSMKVESEHNLEKLLPLKQAIRDAELLAEKCILAELETLSNEFKPSRNKIVPGANLDSYLNFMKVPAAVREEVHFEFGLN